MRPVAGDLAGEARDALAEAVDGALLQAFEFVGRCRARAIQRTAV
jgi:hypothetical protein